MIYFGARLGNGKIEDLPKTLSGRVLSTGNDDKSKKNRRKHYIIDSIAFSLTMVILSLIVYKTTGELDFDFIPSFFNSEIANLISAGLIEFVGLFIVSMVFDYFVGENQVKKYNLYSDEDK